MINILWRLEGFDHLWLDSLVVISPNKWCKDVRFDTPIILLPYLIECPFIQPTCTVMRKSRFYIFFLATSRNYLTAPVYGAGAECFPQRHYDIIALYTSICVTTVVLLFCETSEDIYESTNVLLSCCLLFLNFDICKIYNLLSLAI